MPLPNARRESRRHYRIHYPLRLRPRVEVQGVVAVVIDISEGGIRISHEPGLPVSVGEAVSGSVKLRSGEAARLNGCVVCVTEDEVALSLGRGISFACIVREQRALRGRQRYASA